MSRSAGFALLAFLAFVGAAVIGPPESATAASSAKKSKKKKTAISANFDPSLPVLGTRLAEFPPGAAKPLADKACGQCHSPDMIAQQHLTEKQWTASVNKMIGWGAEVPEDKKEALIAYLVENFGPNNDRYRPVVARPVGK
ncbi:MAG TPA: cytochrome c [Thermoanaerobaculia bacterium]